MPRVDGTNNIHLDETETLEQREDVSKRVRQLRDFGPSTRQQSGSKLQLDAQLNQLGQGFDARRIPLSKLYQMRRDPMIAFASQFVKVPLIRAPWYIECEDAQIAAFIDAALRRIYGRFVLQHSLCLDFGYQALVKRFENSQVDGNYLDPADAEQPEKPIWDEGSIEPVVWKPFTVLPPEEVEPLWTPSGDFDGFTFKVERDISQGFPGQKDGKNKHKVDVLHALWATNEKDSEFGSVWGYPRIGYAYRYWWSYWYNWALADRHFEKDSDPPVVVRYPSSNDVVGGDGNEVDYRATALQLGEDARAGSTIAFPSDTIMSEVDGRPTNTPLWDIKAVEGNLGNFSAFNERFEYLDVAKLRAIMVPEQAFLEGKGGTSSRNVAGELGDRFQESQAVLMAEIDEHLNNYVIPQLVAVNFPEFGGCARKVTRGFGSEDVELAKVLIQLIGQSDANRLPVDVREVLTANGVPTLSPEEEEAEYDKKQTRMLESQLQQQAAIPTIDTDSLASGSQGQKPPPTDKGNNLASVTSTGFYQQPRERIVLSTAKPAAVITYVDEIPGMPTALAWYDEVDNTIYFRSDIEQEQVQAYLQLLGHEEVANVDNTE